MLIASADLACALAQQVARARRRSSRFSSLAGPRGCPGTIGGGRPEVRALDGAASIERICALGRVRRTRPLRDCANHVRARPVRRQRYVRIAPVICMLVLLLQADPIGITERRQRARRGTHVPCECMGATSRGLRRCEARSAGPSCQWAQISRGSLRASKVTIGVGVPTRLAVARRASRGDRRRGAVAPARSSLVARNCRLHSWNASRDVLACRCRRAGA